MKRRMRCINPAPTSAISTGEQPAMETQITFPWHETEQQLRAFSALGECRADRRLRRFELEEGAWFYPPAVFPIRDTTTTPETYLDALPGELGSRVVLLFQAGAASLGYWDGDDLLEHKAIKRYVVRGMGRAQPTHLNAKGKSRYGSRLRLQNAKRLLIEINERLERWWTEHGAPSLLLTACSPRLFADLFEVEPKPPFDRDVERVSIPVDVRIPTHQELVRVQRKVLFGRIVDPS